MRIASLLVLTLGCASAPPVATPVPAPALASAPAPADSAPRSLLEPIAPSALAALIRAPGPKATIVNVWATWCEPCVREFPDVLRAGRDAAPRGVRTLFVSADFEDERDSAARFLREHGVDFTSYVKDGDDQAFIDALSSSWSGSIPATLIFDSQGNLRFFREGEIDHAGLMAALDLVL